MLGAIMRAFFWNVVTVVGLGLILSAAGVLAYQCILGWGMDIGRIFNSGLSGNSLG
jgi:hypothetical protein